jgi:hypothetical protein
VIAPEDAAQPVPDLREKEEGADDVVVEATEAKVEAAAESVEEMHPEEAESPLHSRESGNPGEEPEQGEEGKDPGSVPV